MFQESFCTLQNRLRTHGLTLKKQGGVGGGCNATYNVAVTAVFVCDISRRQISLLLTSGADTITTYTNPPTDEPIHLLPCCILAYSQFKGPSKDLWALCVSEQMNKCSRICPSMSQMLDQHYGTRTSSQC